MSVKPPLTAKDGSGTGSWSQAFGTAAGEFGGGLAAVDPATAAVRNSTERRAMSVAAAAHLLGQVIVTGAQAVQLQQVLLQKAAQAPAQA